MRFLKVTGELKTLTSEYKSWYFTATCGNGPPMSSASSVESCSVALPFSSANVAEGTLKLQLYAHKISPEGKAENDEGKGEAAAEATVLVATRTITVQTNENAHGSNFKLKKSGGDSIETTASFTHTWLLSPSHAAVLSALRTPHVAISASVAFSSTKLREELSLRVLNPEGECLGTASITATGHASALIILAYDYKDQPLELSVASKTAGVFSTPLELGVPLVSKISTEEDEGEEEGGGSDVERGCMLLSTLMRAPAGPQLETGGSGGSGEAANLESRLASFGPVRHLFSHAGEEKQQHSPSPSTSLVVYHLEMLDPQADSLAEHDATLDHLITAGVMDGPVLSRLDLPSVHYAKHSVPMFGRRCQYFVDTSPRSKELPEQDISAALVALQAQSVHNLMYLNQDQPLSANRPLTARLSILAVTANVSDSDTGKSDEKVDSEPSVRLLASCRLLEVQRSTLPLAELDPPERPDDKGTSTATTATASDHTEFVLLRGSVDYISSSLSSQSPLDPMVRAGDTMELCCALSPLTVPSSSAPTTSQAKSKVDVSNAVVNDESLFSMHSSKSALIEPVPSTSQHSSTQSLLNELGRLLHTEEAPKVDPITDGSDQKRLIDVLTNELQEKQRLIDRLLQDNREKIDTTTEQAAAAEILRQEISKLQISLTESRAALSYREQESNAAVRLAEDGVDSPASLQQYSRPVLVQAVIECCNRLKQVDQERIDLKKVIGDSVSVRKQYISLTQAYKELQGAHLSQSKHIQKMQKQHAKVKTYQNTIVMQEKVITKMQAVIESHLRAAASSHSQPQGAPLSASLPSRQRQKQEQHMVTVDKDSIPEYSLTQPSEKSARSIDLQAQVAKLKAEIASKDIRIDALQDQLTVSATEASREIASLRTRLFELEIAGHGSSVGDDQDSNDGIGEGGHHPPALSQSLSNDLFLVPFQQALQEDNEHLRQEVATARSMKSQSRLASSADSKRGPGGEVVYPVSNSSPGLAQHRKESESGEGPSTGNSFIDLSGITHRSTEVQQEKIPVPPPRTSSISLVNAYRPNSISGSPRPHSPSEVDSGRSSSHSRIAKSTHSGEPGGGRRNSHSDNGSIRRKSGSIGTNDDPQDLFSGIKSKAASRVPSKVNSRVSSRIASPVNSQVINDIELVGGGDVDAGGSTLGHSRRGSRSVGETDSSLKGSLLEY